MRPLPLRRPMFIVNRVAGGGRAKRAEQTLRNHLRACGLADLPIIPTQRRGHATELAYAAAAAGFDPVVGVGGDGTLGEIVTGLLGSANPPVLGVIPAGTGNDFATSVQIPTQVVAAVDLVLRGGTPRQIDLGRCGARYFLNAGGAGFDAQVSKAVNAAPPVLRFGALMYVLFTLRELVGTTNRPVTIRLDGTTIHRRAFMVTVANGPLSAGGMRLCPDAARDDGLLDVCIVGDVSRREVLGLLPKVFRGGHVGHPKVEIYRAAAVEIAGPQDASAQVDGELVGTLPVEFRVADGALRVLTPMGRNAPR